MEAVISELVFNSVLLFFFVWCSYVQASYAHFLWDSEEDEDEEEEKEVKEEGSNQAPAHKLVHGVPPSPPPLAAAA